MCGIAGVVSGCDQVGEYDLPSLARTLRHRGPDDNGYWQSCDRRVGFAHTRLSILDLSREAGQPMTRDAESLVIAFNGEIYNFKELRATLESAGFTITTTSDTEVLLYAYRYWGLNFLKHLNGMFSFAIYDARERRVVLARDRAGEKPLF